MTVSIRRLTLKNFAFVKKSSSEAKEGHPFLKVAGSVWRKSGAQ
jgi:hypothetical protein